MGVLTAGRGGPFTRSSGIFSAEKTVRASHYARTRYAQDTDANRGRRSPAQMRAGDGAQFGHKRKTPPRGVAVLRLFGGIVGSVRLVQHLAEFLRVLV